MRSIRLIAAALVAGVLGGCLAPHRAVIEPVNPPACRAAVTTDGSPARIDWTIAEPAGDRAALDKWCRSVGPAVVLSRRSREVARSFADLAVVSWNVEVGGGNLDALLDRLIADRHSAFVVLLQEAYRGGSLVPPAIDAVPRRISPSPPSGIRHSIVEIAERRGLSLVYVPSMRNGANEPPRGEDRGNAILSTLPLSDVRAIELPFEHQRRVAVAATVQLPVPADERGRRSALRLVCAHLDTRTSWLRGGFLWFGRARQARALLRAIGPIDVPTILGGDFNSWLGGLEPDVRQTRRHFPDTPPPDVHVTFPLLGSAGFHLDHLFVRLPGNWRVELSTWRGRWGSDHYPIVAFVRPRCGGANACTTLPASTKSR
jgi:endonuclease/exonuclease/phosphatase family metal-dependent hydrolase